MFFNKNFSIEVYKDIDDCIEKRNVYILETNSKDVNQRIRGDRVNERLCVFTPKVSCEMNLIKTV